MKYKTMDIRELRRLLRIDSDGNIYWRNNHSRKTRAGAIAGTNKVTNTCIYRRIAIHGKIFYSHRVAWALYYGRWPEDQIDHINHVGDDNRKANLREVNNAENSKNRSINGNSISGCLGVIWNTRHDAWRVTMGIDGKNTTLGEFKNLFDAVALRKSAENKYGFHENHGDKRTK